MDQDNCVTYLLENESSCEKFNASSQNQDPECSDFGNRLYDYCKTDHVKCVFKTRNTPSSSISLEYFCKGNWNINLKLFYLFNKYFSTQFFSFF